MMIMATANAYAHVVAIASSYSALGNGNERWKIGKRFEHNQRSLFGPDPHVQSGKVYYTLAGNW